jgi:hypothetical protein
MTATQSTLSTGGGRKEVAVVGVVTVSSVVEVLVEVVVVVEAVVDVVVEVGEAVVSVGPEVGAAVVVSVVPLSPEQEQSTNSAAATAV